MKDSSLRLPHGEKGKVVEIREFSRDDHRDMPAGVDRLVRVSVAQRRKITEGDKMAGRHGNKGVISRVVPVSDMPYLPDGTAVDIILNPLGVPARMNVGQILETHLGWAADRLGLRAVSPVFDGADESELEGELARAWLIDSAWRELGARAVAALREGEIPLEELSDDDEVRSIYLRENLEIGDDMDMEAVLHDRTLTRHLWLRQWLREKGYEVDGMLVFDTDGLTLAQRTAADEASRNACLRLWLEEAGEDVAKVAEEDLRQAATSYALRTGNPLPISGKMILCDGKTGEPFDQPVTVGVIYMMKLAHLVEDKVHARSTGPYSLVTQQPLGGKAQFGGQRFGEMEVWALEAYGAAYTLQEMLTVKSDDVTGRVKTYESIVKGLDVVEPGIPESFRVLVKELQSLGLSVEVFNEKDERVQFGREETVEALPRLGLGGLSSGFDSLG